MRKKTDGGHAIPEEDLREMEQEEGREMPEGVESQTGYCRFCGQGGVVPGGEGRAGGVRRGGGIGGAAHGKLLGSSGLIFRITSRQHGAFPLSTG